MGETISLEASGKKAIGVPVTRFKIIAALLLLAFWLPISSHEMLEHWGVIHTQASNPIDKHDDDHDAADGLCVNAASHVQAPQPGVLVSFAPIGQFELWLVASAVVDGSVLEATGPAPPGAAPPELPQTWHFVSRTALPARAPSLTS